MKHWHECWRYTSHHACAVEQIEWWMREVEALREANTKVRQENELLQRKLDEMGVDWSALFEEILGSRRSWTRRGDKDWDVVETLAREALEEEAV